MTIIIGAEEARTHLSSLLDRVATGEQITITRHGTPVARLVPARPAASAELADVIARLQEFNKGRTLHGLGIRNLIGKGRR
jgi:prevent-host-death family protein